MQSKVTVSGNIISELSEKIPSNIIALNELIKNAYDAGASKVSILLNSSERKLIIIDDGEGMGKEDIDALFHISSSNKIYGTFNEKYQRYTQGSKGLGFLSVFKFGKKVMWETKKNLGYRFGLNYDDLNRQFDISEYTIQLETDEKIMGGTKIEIDVSDYNIRSLMDFFGEEKNYKKVLNAFDDITFEIEINIDGTNFSNKSTTKLLENAPDNRLYHVIYSSNNEKIIFYYNNYPIIEEPFPFTSKRYSIKLELAIFQLPPYGKGKIDKLYLNPNNDLSPLIYINHNLFNNYDIFDSNIMRNIKTDQTLNQMIGIISIISADSDINFNSDRSQFLQNELTDEIKLILQNINKKIQIVGSAHKKYLKDFNILTSNELPKESDNFNDNEKFRKYIKSDFAFRDIVEIERDGNEVRYSLWGKEIIGQIRESEKLSSKKSSNRKPEISKIPAKINLNVDSNVKISIPSEQIDLYTYISSIRNSKGESVAVKNINVKIDGKSASNIIPSFAVEKKIDVEFSYLDSQTGLVIKGLILEFVREMSVFRSGNIKDNLIEIPSSKDYTLNYNPYINKIVEQINELKLSEYKEIIACCLRSLFEMSMDSLMKSGKYNDLFGKENKFEKRVGIVIRHIKETRTYCGEIAKAATIDYHSLNNMLDISDYESAISKAHLGAHKSMTYLSDDDIKKLCALIGIFLVIVNEMITNENIR